ncbi:MAG: hypothetical protein WB441_07985 [Nocardioidaceae bacterium]
MANSTHGTPELMPVLSRGKHRSPKKGACFMEMASYLAGESWSDHPRCTHPLLASLARDVNDHVGDHARARLAPLIPEVIGLNGEDPRLDAWIAREAALTALPVTSAERQGVAAVGAIRCERVLNQLDGLPRDHLDPRTAAALDMVPHARDWAHGFTTLGWGGQYSFARRSAPAIVHSAVSGIAGAAVSGSDTILVALLERTVGLCRDWLDHEPPQLDADAWERAGRLTTSG